MGKMIAQQNNIYLIGFMGAGKTTVGKLLACSFDMGFVDLDEEIIKRHRRSINEIFSEEGEDVFRRYESEILQELSVKEGLVFSTGGGIIGSDENWQIMNTRGVVVFLACSWQTLLERLRHSSDRPLVNQNDVTTLKALYERRLERYRKADVQIDVDDLSPEEVVWEIKQMLAQG